MKIKNILWAYDGSKESKYALKYAVLLAELYKSKIIGLYVNTIHTPITQHYAYYAHYLEDVAEENDKNFKLKFKCISEHLSNKNIKFNSKVIRGDAEYEIQKIADEKKIDLIVMGMTGRGLLGRLLLGSTTLKVLRNSEIPVLAVRNSDENSKIKINKVLVPIDLTEDLTSSLDHASEIASKVDANITAIYVAGIGSHIEDFPASVIEKIISDSQEKLKKLIDAKKEKLKKKNINVRINSKVLFGLNESMKINDYAKRNNFDLIVMNSHGEKGLKRFFLGSVTEEVIRNSSCSVLAIKP